MLKYPVEVFLDTNIFISAKYDFFLGALGTLLSYIEQDHIKLYYNEIVEKEVKKHIANDISEMMLTLKKIRKETGKHLSSSILDNQDKLIATLFSPIKEDILRQELEGSFDEFLTKSRAMKIDSDIDCCKLIHDYFAGVPPFENKIEKKNEFPDAIMSIKLRTLFNKDRPIYIISKDEGFRKSFDGYEGFTTLDSLKILFDKITRDNSEKYEYVKNVIGNKNNESLINHEIKDQIENEDLSVDGQSYDRKGYSEGFEYDEAIIDDITNITHEIDSIEELTDHNEYFIVKCILLCNAFIIARCSYFDEDNSAWDPESKAYLISRWGKNIEKHVVGFECSATFHINKKDASIHVRELNFELLLNSDTLVEREILSDEEYSAYLEDYTSDEEEF